MTGEQFKLARLSLAMSAAEMGRAVGVTGRAVRYYEASARVIPAPVAIIVKLMLEDPKLAARLREAAPVG